MFFKISNVKMILGYIYKFFKRLLYKTGVMSVNCTCGLWLLTFVFSYKRYQRLHKCNLSRHILGNFFYSTSNK